MWNLPVFLSLWKLLFHLWPQSLGKPQLCHVIWSVCQWAWAFGETQITDAWAPCTASHPLPFPMACFLELLPGRHTWCCGWLLARILVRPPHKACVIDGSVSCLRSKMCSGSWSGSMASRLPAVLSSRSSVLRWCCILSFRVPRTPWLSGLGTEVKMNELALSYGFGLDSVCMGLVGFCTPLCQRLYRSFAAGSYSCFFHLDYKELEGFDQSVIWFMVSGSLIAKIPAFTRARLFTVQRVTDHLWLIRLGTAQRCPAKWAGVGWNPAHVQFTNPCTLAWTEGALFSNLPLVGCVEGFTLFRMRKIMLVIRSWSLACLLSKGDIWYEIAQSYKDVFLPFNLTANASLESKSAPECVSVSILHHGYFLMGLGLRISIYLALKNPSLCHFICPSLGIGVWRSVKMSLWGKGTSNS